MIPRDSILALAAYFKKHDMQTHIEMLRAWYGKRPPNIRVRKDQEPLTPWDDAFVIHWMSLLQIPPYENAYQVHKGSGCPTCPPPTMTYVRMVWPTGHLSWCNTCRAEWIKEDKPPPPRGG